MELIVTKENIHEAARQLWQAAKACKIWAFHGEMGSGKTTFIHALCDVLGVSSVVGSPTYAIINEYKSVQVKTIYHMDWYRLKDEEEAIQAGVDDTLYSNELCFIEWPEKAENLLPPGTLHIYIEVADPSVRKLSVPLLQQK